MDKKRDVLGIFLAGVTGGALLLAIFARAFLPRMILPRLNGPMLILLSLIVLVLDYYLAKGSKRDYRLLPVYAFLIFGVFPWMACFLTLSEAAKTAVLGAVIFTVCTFLFDTMIDRLSGGPVAKAAPLVSAFGLYLASQCLMGIL